MRKAMLWVPGLVGALWLAACGGESETPDVSAARVSEEARETFEAARDYTFQKRQQYQQALEGYLDEMDRRIDALEASASRTADSAAASVREELDALRRERRRAAQKLDQIGSATAETWKDAKASLERTVEDLERSLDRLKRRLG